MSCTGSTRRRAGFGLEDLGEQIPSVRCGRTTHCAVPPPPPDAGAETDGLTEFQKRNREKSVYRGIESLLEYRSPLAPDTPIFCPVLFDRHTTLDRYRTNLEVDAADRQAALPVFEVLNLIGLLPLQQRQAPEICQLNDKLHRLAVNAFLRKPSELKLENSHGGTPAAAVDESNPYRFEIGESKRETTSNRRHGAGGRPAKGDVVSIDALKRFDRFQDLNHHQLAQLFRGAVRTAPAGTVLIERGGNDNWSYYLLTGAVRLKARDGAQHLVEGGSPKARSSLANLRPRIYSVTAVSPVTYLQIDADFEAEMLDKHYAPRGAKRRRVARDRRVATRETGKSRRAHT